MANGKNRKAMAIQSIGVLSPFRPGYALQNKTQKTTRYSPPGKNYITSYRENFCNWEIQKKESFKPADNLIRTNAKFQAISSYQADYCLKTSTGAQVPKPQSLHGAVSYALQYAMKPTQPSKLQQVIHAPNSAAPPKTTGEVVGSAARQAFAHSTEYKDNFRAWPVPPVYQHTYPPYDPPKGTMQFLTSYACDYRPWGNAPLSFSRRSSTSQKVPSNTQPRTWQSTHPSKVPTPTRTRPAQRR